MESRTVVYEIRDWSCIERETEKAVLLKFACEHDQANFRDQKIWCPKSCFRAGEHGGRPAWFFPEWKAAQIADEMIARGNRLADLYFKYAEAEVEAVS